MIKLQNFNSDLFRNFFKFVIIMWLITIFIVKYQYLAGKFIERALLIIIGIIMNFIEVKNFILIDNL